MDFSKFDLVLLFTMAFGIILMSFVFPELGMTDSSDAVQKSEIPEYNTSNSTYDFAGSIPNMGVNSPTSGTMKYDQTNNGAGGIEGLDLFWIDRPKQEGTSIQLVNNSGSLELWFRDWNNGSVTAKDDYVVPEEGGEVLHNNASWTLEMDVVSVENRGQPNMTAEVDFLVRDTPDGAGGGFNFDGLGDIAQVLAYLAVVITWGVVTVVEFSLNVAVTILEVSTFLIDLTHFVVSSYFDVVSSASDWAAVVLMIPGMIMSLELGKIGLILISLLPTT